MRTFLDNVVLVRAVGAIHVRMAGGYAGVRNVPAVVVLVTGFDISSSFWVARMIMTTDLLTRPRAVFRRLHFNALVRGPGRTEDVDSRRAT